MYFPVSWQEGGNPGLQSLCGSALSRIPKLPCLRKGASQIELPAPAPVPGLGKRGGCGKRCRVGLASVIGQGWLGKRCRGSLLLPCFAALAGWLLCLEALGKRSAAYALPWRSACRLPVGMEGPCLPLGLRISHGNLFLSHPIFCFREGDGKPIA